jgi:hypothetical protein
MPVAGKLCVVVGGPGYIVDVEDPTKWEDLAIPYVTDVRELPDQKLIVFADWTGLTAYGKNGKVWQTKRIALDGLEITSISGDRIYGRYEHMGGEECKFEVDLKSGKVKGGINL